MAVKTITVTTTAYEALKGLKENKESFSEMILRVTKRRPLTDFLGIFKGKKGEEFEKAVMTMRDKRTKLHQTRMTRIVKELRGQ